LPPVVLSLLCPPVPCPLVPGRLGLLGFSGPFDLAIGSGEGVGVGVGSGVGEAVGEGWGVGGGVAEGVTVGDELGSGEGMGALSGSFGFSGDCGSSGAA